MGLFYERVVAMIDFIIFLALCVVFIAGWWCGNRYRTVSNLLDAIKAGLRSSLDEHKKGD